MIRIPPWARPRHGRLPGDPEPEQVLVVPGALPPSMTEAVPEYTAPPGCENAADFISADFTPEPELPEGVLGYAVGMWLGGEFLGFTHTTSLSRESAEDEVACWNKRRERSMDPACWRVVEVRLP